MTTHSRMAAGRRLISVFAALGLVALGVGLSATVAAAGNGGAFPQNFNPETTAGFTNTYTTKASLQPQCPNALAGTPGSDPASKVLNASINTAATFVPGGTVHYTYLDNPHTNGGTGNFTIQDCEVVYPANFFPPGSVDPTTGLVTGVSKAQLDSGGTPIDGASLSGIAAPTGPIYFTWTAPATLVPGQWVCNFARDIKNNHGGGGNRKVPPTCFQVGTPPQPQSPTFSVFFGYADSYRPASFVGDIHPTPWQGDPNVVFEGCNTSIACPTAADGTPLYDGGAVRILNTGTSSFTVTPGTVVIGGCTFDPWSGLGAIAVAPGQNLILTQTGGTPPACIAAFLNPPNAPYNFDTSESAGLSCVPSGAIPQVHVLINGTPTVLNDTKQIMNTRGVDGGTCTVNGNETTAWTAPGP